MPTTLRTPGHPDRSLDRDVPALLAEGVDTLWAQVGGGRVELDDGTVRVEIDPVSSGRLRLTTRWGDVSAVEEVDADSLPARLHDPGVPLGLDGRRSDTPVIPAIDPHTLGAASFRVAHGVRANLVAGAMAGGIASPALVNAMGRGGFLGYFGAGGLGLDAVEAGLKELDTSVPVGANLLHNPVEPAVEEQTVELYLKYGIHAVDASAYMTLTPAVVRYRLHGIHEEGGRIVVPNRLAAKISRPEVAEPFLRPAPKAIVDELVKRGQLTERQGQLAAHVTLADDITAEADSGGHTDRRPLPVLIPVIRRLADRVATELGREPVRVGAAGGLGDPWSVAAAFALGADYVMTGSVNQATVEAGTSTMVKEMLAAAGYADVAMGPAPDMFEIGAHVQVLSRGSMYAQRASRLYELYRGYDSIEAIPTAEREKVEKQFFARPLAEVWAETERYWQGRDPREVERAQKDPRHKMALTFRWYLGMTSRWARQGDAARKRDFQVWCGAAMGLFNDWVRGSALEPLPARGVVAVSEALLRGAAVVMRVNLAKQLGLDVGAAGERVRP